MKVRDRVRGPPNKKIDTNKFGLNSYSKLLILGSKLNLQGPTGLKGGDLNTEYFMIKSITSVNNWYLMRKRLVLKLDYTTPC